MDTRKNHTLRPHSQRPARREKRRAIMGRVTGVVAEKMDSGVVGDEVGEGKMAGVRLPRETGNTCVSSHVRGL